MALATNDPVKGLQVLKDPSPAEMPKDWLEIIDALDVPSLYVIGDKDRITPAVDIKSVLARKSRKDADYPMAELKVFPGKHAFEEGEDAEAPAEAIKTFLLRALSFSDAAANAK